MISAAHAAGYPARYVAGHLYRPDAGETHAAHGWAELHVAGYGWIGFDPLEGVCPNDAYVRVAVGLDHREAAPISGARTGGGEEALAVDVHVGPSRRGRIDRGSLPALGVFHTPFGCNIRKHNF